MKKSMILFAVLTLLTTQTVAQSNTDMTDFMQGLQSLNGNGRAPGTQSPSMDQLKASMLMKAGMAAIDTDRSGTVSKPELAVTTNKLFDVADANHDGQLSEQELSTFSANMVKVMSMLQR